MFAIRLRAFLLLLFIAICSSLQSQSADLNYAEPSLDYDSNYIQTFPDYINARIYLSRKFTSLRFTEQEENTLIDYQPNTTLNFGIGATINGFTINLAYGFGFLNQNESRGETRYLDLQSHVYGRKYALDLFGQFYTGMYLENTLELIPNFPLSHYLRSDLSVVVLGGSYFRVKNHEKFSYSASLVQNEWQKRSAGSFLYGGKVMLMGASSDTSMIPSFNGDTLFSAFDSINSLASLQFGPGIGYTHTFVIRKHYFITLSLDMNLMISSVSYERTGQERVEEFQLNSSFDARIAMGYNSERSYFGLSYVEDENNMKSEDNQVVARFGVGNFRLNYVRRFLMGAKFKQVMDKYLP